MPIFQIVHLNKQIISAADSTEHQNKGRKLSHLFAAIFLFDFENYLSKIFTCLKSETTLNGIISHLSELPIRESVHQLLSHPIVKLKR